MNGSVSAGLTFKAWDQSDGTANGSTGIDTVGGPKLLGTYNTPGSSFFVTLSADGSKAYVGDYSGGLRIIDVTSSASPSAVGTYTSNSTYECKLSADGTKAYIADGNNGLRILDISNPSSPVLLGTYNTPGSGFFVTLSADGSKAYVGDGSSGLQIINISNPASPSLLGTYTSGTYAYEVALSSDGTKAYVADYVGRLLILDVSNPAAPTQLGAYTTPSTAFGVKLSSDGTKAYVGDTATGLLIIDISNAAAPTLLGSYNTQGSALGLQLSSDGSKVYVADMSAGLQIIDVSNAAAPALLGTYDTTGSAYGVALSSDGSKAYVADFASGLQIISVDLTVPSAFSTATDTISLTLTAANDAPVASGAASLAAVAEDTSNPAGATVSSLFTARFSDSADQVSGGSSANTLAGIAITGYTANASQGAWQYSTDAGASWTTLTDISGDATALTLQSSDKLRFLPAANYNGTPASLTTRLIDSSSSSVTSGATLDVSSHGGTTAISNATVALTTSITAVNDAPLLTGDLTANILTSASYTLTSSDLGYTDVDDVDTGVTFTVSNLSHGSVKVDGVTATSFTGADLAAGKVSFTHDGNAATTASFDVQVEDGNEDVSTPTTSTFHLTVAPLNTPPTITGTLADTVLEGGSLTLTTTALNFADAEDGAANVTFTVGALTHGSLLVNGTAGTSFTGAQLAADLVSFVHDGSDTTSASFTVQVEDGNQDLSTPVASTFNLTVTPVNDAPAGTDATLTVIEDGSHAFIDADFGFSDTDGHSLAAVKITTLPAAGSLTLDSVAVTAGQTVSAADIAAGKLVYAPAANANGSAYASFTFQVQDSGGTANGGIDTDPSANTVTFNVGAVNDAPTVAAVSASGSEDAASIAVTLSGSDVDGSIASYAIATLPSHGTLYRDATLTQAVVAGTPFTEGTLYFVPTANWNGSTSFDYHATDNQGATSASAATASISVSAVNDAPTAGDPANADWNASAGQYAVATPEDTPRSGSIDASDVDGNTLSFAAAQPSHGSVAIDAATGAWTYTPTANFNGNDAFVVTVSDGHGGSRDVTVAVTVTPVNDAPTAGDPANADWNASAGQYALATPEDTPRSGSIDASDVDGNTLSFAAAQPSHGSVSIDAATGAWTYTPTANFNGNDAFVVTVSDGHGGSRDVTVAVTVTPVNDAPSFGTPDPADTQFTTSQDSPWSGALPTATDGDSATLTYDLAEGPAHGAIVVDPDGHYRYVPTAGFHGSDSFLARVSDGAGGSATLRIDVTVNPAPTMRLPAESDLGVSNSDRVTSANEIALTGQAQPNQTLHLYAPDGHLLATVVADADRTWKADGLPIATLRGDAAGAAAGAPGAYTFTLRPVQADGQDGAAVTLGVTRELPPVPRPAPTVTVAEPPAEKAPAVQAQPVVPEARQPAFDSALRPAQPQTSEATTPRTSTVPVPQAFANEGDIYTRPNGFRTMVSPSSEPSLKTYRGVDDQVVPAGRTLAVQIPADTFVHTQINETVTLTAKQANGQPLPAWLMFDGKSGKFVGQPPEGVLQDLAIQVTARDSQGRQATTMFRIKTGDGAITPSRSPLSLQLMRREALALNRVAPSGRGDAPAGWKAVSRTAMARG